MKHKSAFSNVCLFVRLWDDFFSQDIADPLLISTTRPTLSLVHFSSVIETGKGDHMDFTFRLVEPVTGMVITAADFILTHEVSNVAILRLLLIKVPHFSEVQGAGVLELSSILLDPRVESTPVLADQHRIKLCSLNHIRFLFLFSPFVVFAVNDYFWIRASFLIELNCVKAPPFGKDRSFGLVIS